MKEEVVFDWLEDRLASEVMELAHAWHAAAASSDPWDSEGKTFEASWRECNRIYRSVGKLKLPWYKRWQLDDVDELARRIRQFYAQERDPEFRKWRDRVKKEMHDKIEQSRAAEETLRKAAESIAQLKKEQERKARESNERRKASGARRPARPQAR